MKKWNSEQIKELRWRLGWSQAELARQLGCRQQTISEWETEQYTPQNAYSKLLEILANRADSQSHRIRQLPLADTVMKKDGLQQISLNEVMNFHDSELALELTQVGEIPHNP